MSLSFAQVLEGLLAGAQAHVKTAQISTNPRSFFVHVRVPEHIAANLREVQKKVVPDVSKHEEIDHVTLVFCKKAPDDLPSEKVHAALDAMREIGQRTEPIEARIQGWAHFDSASKDGKPSTALVALLDAPMLQHLHVDIARALDEHGIEPSQAHGFVPHITFSYLGDNGRTDESLPVLSGKFTVDRVHVAARDHHEIPLTGSSSLGRKAAEFAMNPRDLQKDPKGAPGKGTTTPSIGGVPLQGST